MKTRTVQLGDVATVFNGKTPSKIEQRRIGFPVLKIRDVDEFGRFTGQFTSFVEPGLVAGLPGTIVRDGDTLVLNAAHNADYVGSKSFFASGSVVGSLATGEWLIIRPDLGEADARYLYFWSLAVPSRNRIRALVKGIHLYPKDVADIALALPDLSEQRRVARELEQADRLRRTRRYALELTDTFLPAVFLELFGDPVRNEGNWRTQTLEFVATKITDGEHLNPKFVHGGFPIVMAEQVDEWGVNLDSCKHVSPQDFARMRAVQREALRQAEHLFASLLHRAFSG